MYKCNHGADNDGAGSIPLQKAFYVAGGLNAVKNFITFLDSFVTHVRASKSKAARKIPEDLKLNILNCTGHDI